ncbi:hypothetical protein HAX54_005903, partial [Datura stramonium]|nr:hypothetical protein [Datura stramonium]
YLTTLLSMTSWYINGSNDGYAYLGDPCLNCGGPHLWQHCNTCGVCGSPGWPLDPHDVFYSYRNNEEEEHHAQIRNMGKQILEHMKVMREKLTEQGKALKGMSAKLTEMMAEAATCNICKSWS